MTPGDGSQDLARPWLAADDEGMKHPRLYLVRHGETDWNAAGRLLSFTDAPLNARGEEQAATLASTVAVVRWDRAISSPLVRARRTAEIILAARADAPALEIDDRLRELDFGPYEGWSEAQLEADALAATRRRDGAQIPGIEPDEEVAERARSFLASLDGAGETTLVVGHGRTLRILMATALGLPPSFAWSLRMRNCRPAVLEPGRTPLLLALNAGDPSFEANPTS
jgi:broad specificity phosphatase PhoE